MKQPLKRLWRRITFGIGIEKMCASIPIPTPTFPVVVLFSEQT